jgi:TPR repeat protein
MAVLLTIVCLLFVNVTSATPIQPQPDAEHERALAAARILADAGDVVAQFSLGSLLYYGAKDTGQAIDWLRKAAAQQYAPAEFQLGIVYEFGFGAGQDDREALAWYRRAAEHGSAAGQRTLGDFHRKGRAVAVDLAEAARWYRLGADGDDIRAQYELGEMCLNGTGVARDNASAYVWFSLAASQAPLLDNRKQLIELRNVAAARMTPEELKDAARRVAAWKARGR